MNNLSNVVIIEPGKQIMVNKAYLGLDDCNH